MGKGRAVCPDRTWRGESASSPSRRQAVAKPSPSRLPSSPAVFGASPAVFGRGRAYTGTDTSCRPVEVITSNRAIADGAAAIDPCTLSPSSESPSPAFVPAP